MSIKLSACTITKNEADNIKKSIDSYKNFVDEIIIVDTGSVDDTVKIAKEAGAKVFEYEWENDFAAAKNFALDNCSGDWIIFLDADEWFDGDTAKNIEKAINNTIKSGYSAISCRLVNFADENEILEVGCTLRVFKNDENIKFERPIHEVLVDKSTGIPVESLYSDLITINHSGYMRKILKSKAERNKRLIDKAYAEGKASNMDYYYGLRENLTINLEVSDYFYKLINNIPDYREKIAKYNIGSTLDDNMFRLVSKLPNRYSFEKRLEVLKTAQENFPDNPLFKYYEYNMFYGVNRKRAIMALEEAVKLSEDYEKKHPDKVNSFYPRAGESFVALGEHSLLMGDKNKALEYFSSAVKFEYFNVKALIGILYIIKEQKNEDIILFLNSIYDTDNKEKLQFLVENLRLTSFHDVFLYYFVTFNKKFNEIDSALFTSRIITGNFDEIADTYMNVFNETKDNRALKFVSSAIICGNAKEKYSEISLSILPAFSKIINAYFNDEPLENITDIEYNIGMDIFKEIAFVASDDILKRYINVFKISGEKIWLDIIRHYFGFYEYENVLKVINWVSEEDIDNKDFHTYINYVLTNIYFRNRNFDKIEETLDKTILGGFLDIELVLMCEILEANDEKLDEYFKLFDSQVEMRKVEQLDKLKDMSSDSIFFLNIDKFKENISNSKIWGVREQVKEFFDFANKALDKKAYAYAEKYYKIALKLNYCVDKCYYALGRIYNHFNKPELSYYCYEKAFCENLMLANSVLPKGHRNYNYVFSKKQEIHHKNCPICGKEARPFSTYVNIDNDKLSYSEPLITTYMKCEECKHVFLKNEIKDKEFWRGMDETRENNENIEEIYTIFDMIALATKKKQILAFTDSRYFCDIGNSMGYETNLYEDNIISSYDIIYDEKCLTSENDILDKVKLMYNKLSNGGVILFKVYDLESIYSNLGDKPLWAKENAKNVFSKLSIEKILSKYGLKIQEIKNNRFNKGEIFVFASR